MENQPEVEMMMNVRKNVLWLTRTALFIALLVAVQFATAPLGNQLITGSAGNLIMIISLLTCGLATGFTVAGLSPAFASLVGVGPAFPPLIPFIAIGNATLVAVWYFLGLLHKSDQSGVWHYIIKYLIAIVAAIFKFVTLYAGIVLFAVPYILHLNEKQSAMLGMSFSYPQIITATIGGVIALAIVPLVQKALPSMKGYA